MMLAQASHRLPEILLGTRTEDLGRLPLSARIDEEETTPPVAIITPAETQADGDGLAFEAERGKIVDDGIARVMRGAAKRLHCHPVRSGRGGPMVESGLHQAGTS